MPNTVGRLIVDSLEAHDIDLVYCVPGESYLGFTNAMADNNRMRLIVCRHEGGAAFMAAADGRMRGGRAGMLVVSRGPGLSNAMIGLHTAWHDATPLVVLIGQVERWEAGRMALQEQNYSRLLSDVTKLVIEVNEPEQASEAMARAFHVAESGTPGPVAVVIPEDVFDAETRRGPRQAATGGAGWPAHARSRPPGRDAGKGRTAAALGRRGGPSGRCGRYRQAGRRLGAAGDADPSAPASVRPGAPQLRRLDVGPGASRGDGPAEADRPARGARRAAGGLDHAGLYLSRRARPANAAGACLARTRRGRQSVPPRARHSLRACRGGWGAAGAGQGDRRKSWVASLPRIRRSASRNGRRRATA